MIKLRRARLPSTEPRMMARFLSDEPPLSLGFEDAVAANGVFEVEEAVELRLVDEEVRLEGVVLEEVDREDLGLEVEEVDVDEVLLDEVELGDTVIVTVVGFADTTDRTIDRPTARRLSNSLWLVVAADEALVVCAQDKLKKRVMAVANNSLCAFMISRAEQGLDCYENRKDDMDEVWL
jgi:ClpP class serine protease